MYIVQGVLEGFVQFTKYVPKTYLDTLYVV